MISWKRKKHLIPAPGLSTPTLLTLVSTYTTLHKNLWTKICYIVVYNYIEARYELKKRFRYKYKVYVKKSVVKSWA